MLDFLRSLWPFRKRVSPNTARLSRLRPVLAGGVPGYWASNHLEETRHYSGWTYCAVHALALQAAQASVAAFHEDPRGRRHVLPRRHRVSRLLRRPNPGQRGGAFRYACVQQLRLTGTALVWVVKDGWGVPAELYCVPTALALPQVPTPDYPMGSYRIAPLSSWASAAEAEVLADGWEPGNALGELLVTGGLLDFRQVRPVRWPHPLYPSDGLSPLAAMATEVDVAEQLARARWYDLKNASRPGYFFKLDPAAYEGVSDEDREAFREQLRARAAGTPNAGKDMVLPPGVQPEEASRGPAEMDYTGSWPQARDAVLAGHQSPPIALGISEAGSYAAFYASLKQYTELCVRPTLQLLAEGLEDALACPQWEGVGVGMEPRAIDDPTVKESRLTNAARAGAIRRNEYRKEIGLPPVSREEGGEDWLGQAPPKKDGGGTGGPPGPGDEERTGVQSPLPVPGKRNGRRRKSEWHEGDHPRQDNGEFGAGDGGSEEEEDPVQARRDREDEEIDSRQGREVEEHFAREGAARKELERAQRDEARQLERRQGKERRALEREQDRETARVEAARGREDDKIQEARDKEDARVNAGRDREDAAAPPTPEVLAAREKEDEEDQARRNAEDDARLAREREEDRAREARHDAGLNELDEKHGAEREKLAAAHAEAVAAHEKEWAARYDALRARHGREDREVQDRRDEEDRAGEPSAAKRFRLRRAAAPSANGHAA